MKAGPKFAVYAVVVLLLAVVAAMAWRSQLGISKPAPSASGYNSDWFACKAHPGWLCSEDGKMKKDPNWKGPREENPWAPPKKLPPGPEAR